MIDTHTVTREPDEVTKDPQIEPPASRPVGHEGTRVDVNEHRAWAVSGFVALLVGLVLLGVGIWQGVLAINAGIAEEPFGAYVAVAAVCVLLAILLTTPLVVIAPGPGSCSSSAATSERSGGPG